MKRSNPSKVLYSPPTTFFQSDCDCACALDLSPDTIHEQYSGMWQTDKKISNLHLGNPSDDWQAFFNPDGPISLVVLNQNAVTLLETYASPRDIQFFLPEEDEDAKHKLIKTGLLRPVVNFAAPQAESHILTAWLHLTDACNLRCDYCYLPHNPVFMPLDVALKSVDQLFETAVKRGYSKVKLKYAGGEPLLKFDMLQSIHAYAKKISEQKNIGFEDVVLTNGILLTPEKIEIIKSLGMRLMISLDGVGENHDAHRKFVNGAPTFEKVERAILNSLAADIKPMISITISGRNLPGLPSVVEYLLKKNLPFAFNFYRENDCSQSSQDLGFSNEQAVHYLSQTLDVIAAQFPEYSLLGSLADRASFIAPHQHVCGAGLDYLVVHPSGKIAKCQMDMQNFVTDIHAPDPLADLRNDETGVQNLPVQQKNECKDCQWQNWCAGGCPIVTYRSTGRYDVRSPYCEIYKYFYPNLLKLEAARLVHQHEKLTC